MPRWTSQRVTATGCGDNPGAYAFEAQGTQHVIAIGNDFHVHELWWDTNGWHTDDLSGPTGAPNFSPGSLLTGYAFEGQGTQHVMYYGGESNNLHELWWDINDGWHHNDLSVATGTPAGGTSRTTPAYAFEAQGTQHVFYVDPRDAHVHELRWSP